MASTVQGLAGMHAHHLPHPGRGLQQQEWQASKPPSRDRASKRMLLMSEEARGMSKFTQQNKQKDLLCKSQSK